MIAKAAHTILVLGILFFASLISHVYSLQIHRPILSYQKLPPLTRFCSERVRVVQSALKASKLSEAIRRPPQALQATDAQFIFVGGKGGVGKTTSASAIALSCSDNGLRTLVVSTDPAHSLGDALDFNLRSGKVTMISTERNLWALEIDVEDALQEFKDVVSQLDSSSLAGDLGIPMELIDSLGIEDLADIFKNPPPGVDEIVALSKIFQFANRNTGGIEFDRIVIDTAPTGHTLRLIQLPVFLNTLTGKLIKFRTKLFGAIESFKRFFASGTDPSAQSPGAKLMGVLDKLDNLQGNIQRVQSTLRNADRTQFVVVAIPTSLAVEESKRLIQSLKKEEINVSTIVCNQVLDEGTDGRYIAARAAGQRGCISSLRSFLDATYPSYLPGEPKNLQQLPQQGNTAGSSSAIAVTEVPYVDTEVRGIYGLRFFHSLAHPLQIHSPSNPIEARKLTIFGGKGGVGKTTSATSWAVRLSDSGFRTLVVSSDPAHSLGDALQIKLSGVPQFVDETGTEGGQLWALEIDPTAALTEFTGMIQAALQWDDAEGNESMGGYAAGDSGGGMMSALGLSGLKQDFADMLFDVKNPPPGTDEIVALANIVRYLDDGFTLPNGKMVKFDRIVLDTAPTGHTLRMLQLPDFLQKLLRKIRTLRDKVDSLSNSPFGSMMGMGGGRPSSQNSASAVGASVTADGSKLPDKLTEFQMRMKRLEGILHSPSDCEFTVVTIPTELATAETKRLLGALKEEDILIRRLIINQVISSTTSVSAGASTSAGQLHGVNECRGVQQQPQQQPQQQQQQQQQQQASAYLGRLRSGQRVAISELREVARNAAVPLVTVPYFDTEVRTVYGLRVISNAIAAASDAASQPSS